MVAQRRANLFNNDPADADDGRFGGVGALLRRRREELQQDIEDVSQQLRIRSTYIRAIEEGRFQELPGTAYAVGFVRAYADYLGLDGGHVVGDYRDELARRSRQNDLVWPTEGSESRFPGGAILVVCMLLGLFIYGGWYYATQSGGAGIKLIGQVPEYIKKATGVGETTESGEAPAEPARTEAQAETTTPPQISGQAAPQAPAASPVQPAPAPAMTAAEAPSAATPAPAPSAPAVVVAPGTTNVAPSIVGTTQAQPAQAPSAQSPSDQSASQASAAPAQVQVQQSALAQTPQSAPAGTPPGSGSAGASNAAPAAPTPPSPPDTATQTAEAPAAAVPPSPAAVPPSPAAEPASVPPPAKVVIRANRDAWIEIRNKDDSVLLQKVLRQGESYNVPDQKGLIMTTGNAGGIVIELEGKPLQSLGSLGVVKRGIKLDPPALADGSAFNADADQ
jgi:cytoskeleton protein RodZ